MPARSHSTRWSKRAPADADPRADAEAWSVMLYTSGTTARPKGVPRRQRAERAAALAHVAQNLYRTRRADARRHAALSHHGGALAAGDVAGRRHLRLSAALRCQPRAGADRSREGHQSLSRADALSRPAASPAIQGDRPEHRAQARLRRRIDDRRTAQGAHRGVQARSVRQSLRLVRDLHLHDRSERAGKARLRRARRDQPDRARGSARRHLSRRHGQRRRGGRDHRARWPATNPSRATGAGPTPTPRPCATAGTSPATPAISTTTAICS